ncbi:MAG: HvfC/BufC N-terminal domain-containing protein [Alphaproteobacteria bacterium]
MVPWPELQGAFASALRRPDAPPPGPIGKTQGRPSHQRFNVYRNNVAVALGDALAANFPVVAQLIGAENFANLAGDHTRQTLPEVPMMGEYGKGFATFLEGCDQLADIPYLADVARLERACSRAYHSADAPSLSIDELAALPPDTLEMLEFRTHPAAQIISSQWPVGAIWLAHQTGDPQAGLAQLPEGGQDMIVTRPDLDVWVRVLPPGGGAFAGAVLAGEALGSAAQAGANSASEFDLSANLAALFQSGAISAIISAKD